MAMSLHKALGHIGRGVLYTSPASRKVTDSGVIVGVDDRWIYVLYPGSGKPIKTHPDNLTLARRTH